MNDAGLAIPRETRRFRKKQEAILDAGARLINQRGVKGTALADIARGVGLATNSVTYYYRKKEDLAAACLLSSIRIISGLAEDAGSEKTPAARIRTLFASYLELLAAIERGDHAELVLFNDLRALTGAQAQICFDAYIAMFRSFRQLLRGETIVRLTRSEENSRTHLLLSLFVTVKQLARRYDLEEYARTSQRLCDVLIGGVFAQPIEWPKPEAQKPDANPPGDGEISTESFLRAATVLINEQGYRGASVEKISAYLNVTKGSFYHHNANKDDVVAACFARSFDIVRAAQNDATATLDDGARRLAAIATTLARSQLSGHGPLLRTSAWSALPDEVRYDVLRSMNRQTQRFASIINDGQNDGTVKLVDPLIAAHAVSAMINAVAEIERWVPSVTADNIVDFYVRPFFVGLASAGSAE
ncbi:MAG: hypothetical protein BGP06_05310 [Rhizobiales bacterium 65-9]|nr:MAG: hypothetical protein BGP06_05310 [Rhizobiales bacterium 65-9]